jgi:hypothetical protein
MKHEPVIDLFQSGCTCGRWQGPKREEKETRGAYTLRAFGEWEKHASAAPVARQTELLDQQELF